MKRKLLLSLTLVVLLLLPASLDAWDIKDFNTVVDYTSQQLTLEWDVSNNATSYEVRLQHFERDSFESTQIVTDPTITVQLPRTGHYIVHIRAINDNTGEQSAWSESIDPSRYSGTYEPFWVYGHVEPVGPIVIQ